VMVRTHLEAFADDRVNELRSPSEQEAAWRSRQHMQAAHLRAHPSTGTHS
jgi:hypothetical protein